MDKGGQDDAERTAAATAAPDGDGVREGVKYLNMAHHHRHQDQQEYESGLEVVTTPSPWRPNDVPLPEVAPCAHVDAKAALAPQVADDALAWHYYYKQNPTLEVAAVSPYSPAAPAYEPGGQQHPPGYHHPPATSLDQKSLDADGQQKLFGVRRKLCYIVMGVAIILAVAAIAIGVGVGLAVGRPSSDVSTNLESTKTATITCPAKDNAMFSAQDHPARHFRLICGHDFNSMDGAIDLSSQNATTMADCIDLCAADTECVGAGWGDYYGSRICWLKSRLGKMNTSGNWLFAVDVKKTTV
ncbi:hypothetical protein LY78DRAFT_660684 [Colletotrichum sublineola]|uniref:Apple domain-containing protein n=1 Tax=Colletotrichum sublineola TaxID=1173701 RepID=A0A066X696_COLSU|nr:hypothetical protein LY78DRAFT_660684 [Colletotrichum sublineola]KDN64492.1 hypothetical protein CSUB01_00449 [Colletotrichum sublineola]